MVDKSVSLSCAVGKSEKYLQATGWTIKLRHTNGWSQQKLPKFGFCTQQLLFGQMEQLSILSTGPPECFTFIEDRKVWQANPSKVCLFATENPLPFGRTCNTGNHEAP